MPVSFDNIILVMALVSLSTWAKGQVGTSEGFDPDLYGWDHVLVFREFNDIEDRFSNSEPPISSPFNNREIRIIEESDLTVVPYDQSFSKAVIIENDAPVLTVELTGYKSYGFSWVNREVLYVFYSPGRCTTIETLYNVPERSIIYKRGFGHCGL